jgi:hypothetical protein
MHVFGQHHPCDDFEGMPLFDGAHRGTQIVDVFDQQA